MPDSVAFFVHIPKTAGTTMLQIIEDAYPAGAVLSIYKKSPAEQAAMIAQMAPTVRIVAGHAHLGLATHFPRPCRAFAVLRDPIQRLISNYYYIARKKSLPTHAALKSGRLTMEKLARRQGALQARFLAGCTPDEPINADEVLARAKDALVNQLTVFGLTERFNESLYLFNQTLGWKVRGYQRENVTRDRPQLLDLERAQVQMIRQHSHVDIELYELAYRLFAERLAAEPASWVKDVAALRANERDPPPSSFLRNVRQFMRRRLGRVEERRSL